ncbi:MAG: lipocalin-like domain-containing protein [Vulcanimicrobiaceae bacterium]
MSVAVPTAARKPAAFARELARRSVAAVATLVFATPSLAAGTTRAPVATAHRASASRFTIAEAPYAFVFPRDHGAHDGYQSEWWYYTGHVRAADGRRFGFELTFFRVGLRPGDPKPLATQSRWRGNQLYPAHFALTDEAGKTFWHVDRFAREAIGMGASATGRLDVRADDWTLSGAPAGARDRERMTMHARQETSEGTNAIDFVHVPEKAPAIHGHGGVSRKAACRSCASHYYSYTRLRTTGTLTFHGRKLPIEGLSWMDHEFGSDELQRDQAGWDWFAIQLDDRRELMLYVLRQKDGRVTPQSSGSLVEADGTVRYLPRAAFAIEQTATWKSPHTGGLYPSAWRVRVARAGIDLTLAPAVADQELAGTSTGVSYWEGAVDVRDAAAQKRLGVGYVEMTGYAGAISI